MPSSAAIPVKERVSIVDTLCRTASTSQSPVFSCEAQKAYQSRSASQYHTIRTWIYRVIDDLSALRNLQPNWNSYGSPPPNALAIDNAKKVLQALADSGFDLEFVRASGEGGVAIVFPALGEHRAIIETLNNGETYAMLYDTAGDTRTVEWTGEAELPATIAQIKRYLVGTAIAA